MAACGLRISGLRATPEAVGGASAGGKLGAGWPGNPRRLFRMLIGMTIPLTGTQYEIEAGDYRATVTELGAGLRQLEHAGTPLVTTFDADQLPPHGAGELLSPWPNRVDAGRYSFGGTRYQLALSEPALGNAIHGLTRWVPWTRTGHDRSEVTLTQHSARVAGIPVRRPGRRDLPGRRRIRPARHRHRRQQGQPPAPWGYGQHPYLTVASPTVDDVELTLPARLLAAGR